MLPQDFETQIGRQAKGVIAASHAQGICLLLVSDTGAHGHRSTFIYHEGLPAPFVRCFSDIVYRRDPHIEKASTLSRNESLSSIIRLDAASAENSLIDPVNLYQYWLKLQQFGIRETAARIRRIGDNLFLVIYLISSQCRHSIQIDPAVTIMDECLNDSQRYLLEYCTQKIYFSGSWGSGVTENAALSAREREITACLFQGLRNKQISGKLSISELTVENHLRRIYKKFSVHNRTALMAKLGYA